MIGTYNADELLRGGLIALAVTTGLALLFALGYFLLRYLGR